VASDDDGNGGVWLASSWKRSWGLLIIISRGFYWTRVSDRTKAFAYKNFLRTCFWSAWTLCTQIGKWWWPRGPPKCNKSLQNDDHYHSFMWSSSQMSINPSSNHEEFIIYYLILMEERGLYRGLALGATGADGKAFSRSFTSSERCFLKACLLPIR